jgi:tetratricopeptide (TPR) repeat protein
MFLEAISLDSSYMNAYIGLANLYSLTNTHKYLIKRDSVINIGYRINPNSADVLAMKAFAYAERDGDFYNAFYLDSAFYLFHRAYEIDPANTNTNDFLSQVFGYMGLYDQAIPLGNKIIKSDPLNMFNRCVNSLLLISNGNIDEARKALIKILEIDEHNVWGNHLMLFIAVFHDKNKIETRKIVKRLKKINPGGFSGESWLLAMEEKKEEALSIKLVESYEGSLNTRVATYSLLEMKEEALAVLTRADSIMTMRGLDKYIGSWAYLRLKNIKPFDFIRDEPEFQKILAKAKKVHEERVAKYGHLFNE